MRKDIIIPGIIAVVMKALFSYISEGYSPIYTFVPAIPVAWLLYYAKCYKSELYKNRRLFSWDLYQFSKPCTDARYNQKIVCFEISG